MNTSTRACFFALSTSEARAKAPCGPWLWLQWSVRSVELEVPKGSKYLLRRCLGWVQRVQIPSEEVIGALKVSIIGVQGQWRYSYHE